MKHKIMVVLLLIFTAMLCISSPRCIAAARGALLLCADALLPSLFVFFIVSGLLLRLGFAQMLETPCAPLFMRLFRVGGGGASAVILGLVSGYPVGTLAVKTLYQNGSISKTEAERLLTFCNNTGPLFILGTVGSVLLGCVQAGVRLYAAHVLASLTVGILFRFYKPQERPRICRKTVFYAQPFSVALSESMHAAVKNIFYVCGFTVLFAVLTSLLPQHPILHAVSELTLGCRSVSALAVPMETKLKFLSLVLGFGGVSVHFQLAGILSDTDLSARYCVFGKVLQAVLSYIYVSLCMGG